MSLDFYYSPADFPVRLEFVRKAGRDEVCIAVAARSGANEVSAPAHMHDLYALRDLLNDIIADYEEDRANESVHTGG